MNERQLLVKREFAVNRETLPDSGRITWYSPLEVLRAYPSVIMAEHYNTSSSAGDWDGYFVQKIGNRYYLITFWQENNYPRGGGFTLYTNDVAASWSGYVMSREEVEQIIADQLAEMEV